MDQHRQRQSAANCVDAVDRETGNCSGRCKKRSIDGRRLEIFLRRSAFVRQRRQPSKAPQLERGAKRRVPCAEQAQPITAGWCNQEGQRGGSQAASGRAGQLGSGSALHPCKPDLARIGCILQVPQSRSPGHAAGRDNGRDGKGRSLHQEGAPCWGLRVCKLPFLQQEPASPAGGASSLDFCLRLCL